MAETLYRKYRPQRFADIQGQTGITQTLQNQIASGRTAHAYLLSGTRGTGKTTTARVLAKALNCHTRAPGEFEPCGACPSCVDITAGRSVDVIELDAATHTGVDTVREEIIENARFLPTRDKFKIFIIDEVHMLSTSSFNALLKSLEEPPAHVVYILATTELHKIPATIASRCQRFIFHPLLALVMEEKLRAIALAEKVEISNTVIRRILAASGGAMRDAESLLGQLLATGVTQLDDTAADAILPPTLFSESIELLEKIVADDAAAAFSRIADLFEQGIDLLWLHDALIRHAHELLVVRACGTVPAFIGIFTDTESASLIERSKKFDPSWLAKLLELLLEKKQLYKTISSSFIPLHIVISELCSPVKPELITKSAPVKPVVPTAPIPPAPLVVKPVTPPVAPPIIAAPISPSSSDDFDMPSVSLIDEESDEAKIDVPLEVVDISAEQQIRTHWNAAVQSIISEQPSLGIIISASSIQAVVGNKIELVVSFPMYREKLVEIKIKTKIENRLSELVGHQMTYSVSCVTLEQSQEPELTDIIDTFGGRVLA
ncbi:MAG: DNA polymerase III subunit gamma/tau [Candidatus Magasanikbacteria bacterium]|nr:DNA polymerase III subunit gamma/tau [Candidatus Magasanikbacteria bacterium]